MKKAVVITLESGQKITCPAQTMTAVFPYYHLYDEKGDIRQGFVYERVQHITLKSKCARSTRARPGGSWRACGLTSNS